jgi:hypothetical protein
LDKISNINVTYGGKEGNADREAISSPVIAIFNKVNNNMRKPLNTIAVIPTFLTFACLFKYGRSIVKVIFSPKGKVSVVGK